jgi:hypothetical protein
MLPENSRVMRALNPELVWSWQETLLADIANSLRTLVWHNTKDGHKGRNHPQMIENPAYKPEKKKPQGSAMSVEELRQLLSRPRKPVKEENHGRQHDSECLRPAHAVASGSEKGNRGTAGRC